MYRLKLYLSIINGIQKKAYGVGVLYFPKCAMVLEVPKIQRELRVIDKYKYLSRLDNLLKHLQNCHVERY